MEPSFATISRVFAPYGAGGRRGSFLWCKKMSLVNLPENFSARDWPWRLCKPSFAHASRIYVLEQEQSFQLSHWTQSWSDVKVAGNTRMKLIKKWSPIDDHTRNAVQNMSPKPTHEIFMHMLRICLAVEEWWTRSIRLQNCSLCGCWCEEWLSEEKSERV